MNNDKPLVGVSRCLLGDAVRYDGQSKANRIILDQLSSVFEFEPVCPEVEAGLSIPRPPVQLTGDIKNPRLTGRNDPSIDVTDIMQSYCQSKPSQLKNLSGFIFKSRSPSCGLNTTPVFIDGICVTQNGTGIFSRSLCRLYPNLAVIDDAELDNKQQSDHFIQAVLQYHCKQQ